MADQPQSRSNVMPDIRQVTDAEAEQVTELFTLAFHHDPTWAWAFPYAEKRVAHHNIWWGLYMHSAVPYGCVWMTEDGGAASLWIPPNAPGTQRGGRSKGRASASRAGRRSPTTC